ncbi:MAG TPA: META domain-containing protein [Thermoanaerobaculia bacterium]
MRVLATVTLLFLFSCMTTSSSTATLVDRDWHYVTNSDAKPSLRFTSTDVTGNTGCNQLSGTYTVEGDALTFGPLITTKRACLGANPEQEFLRALEATRRWRVADHQLELLDGNGAVVARFR